MKKNSFMEGAVIATSAIIAVKIIGLLYVIPFNAIIGEKGGALYGYAYNIYMLFLSVSSAGFPFAISKLTSEYVALGYKKAIHDTYKISIKIISAISILIFIVLFVFAGQIGKLIIGDATGGNTYSDIAFVIRMVSFAILIIPYLSVTKGFLQGNKYIGATSISQLIEQLVRVLIIIVGSYVALKIFHTDLKTTVGIAVSGAFFGGLFAYLYLKIKIKKSNLLPEDTVKDEKNVSKKTIVKKILKYSVPFIVISLINNLYNTIDMILISRTLNDILHINTLTFESIVSIFTTWGAKLNNIILAIVTGLTTSLIPNIVISYTKRNMNDVNDKFNKALQCILYIILPLTIFMSLLVEPIWKVFYGNSTYGPIVYKVYVYAAFFGGLYSIVLNTLQGLSKYKLVAISVIVGLICNAILDVPLMILCHKIGMQPSYGAIIAAIIGYSISTIISLAVLNRKYHFKFNETIKKLPSYLVSWIIFVISIAILKLLIPTNLSGRIIQIPILLVYFVISFGIYFVINYLNGNFKNLFERKKK